MANFMDKVVGGIARVSCAIKEDQPLCEAARRHMVLDILEIGVDRFERGPTQEHASRSFMREVFHYQSSAYAIAYIAYHGVRNLLRSGCVGSEEKK